jgi:hypothetical protein
MATVIAAALDEEGVSASVEETDDGDRIVRFRDGGGIGLAIPREATRQASVYLIYPGICPAEHRDELVRLAALVNLDLPVGCLEVNAAIGQARVRASVVRHLAQSWFPAVEQVVDGAMADAALAGARGV